MGLKQWCATLILWRRIKQTHNGVTAMSTVRASTNITDKPTEGDEQFKADNETAQAVAAQNIHAAQAEPPMVADGIMNVPEGQILAGEVHYQSPPNAKKPTILDLPDEVKKNIVGYEDQALDEMLRQILRSFTAAVSVDRVIPLLWTLYQQQPTRAKVMQRLRLLALSGEVQKVDGIRSHYRLVIA